MIHPLLERHASERPLEQAVVGEEGALTWSDLLEGVMQAAAGLSAHGIGEGDRVVLLFPSCTAFVTNLLALARIGAVAVPLDPELKDGEVASLLEKTGYRTLLAEQSFEHRCRDWLKSGHLDHAILAGSSAGEFHFIDRPAPGSPGPRDLPLPGDDADLIELFTSGTTGVPKRVIRTQRHLAYLADAYAKALQISSGDRILSVIPLSHGHGLCSCLLAMLQSGATLVIRRKFNRHETLRLLAEEGITIFPAVPFIFSILADTRTLHPLDLSSLRLCITGGSALEREIWTKVHDRFGIGLRQSYGTSETGAVSVNMDDDPEGSAEAVGRPLDGIEVTVLDENGNPLPPGSSGELAVRSPGAANWFYPSPAESSDGDRERLTDHPDGWIPLGDLGTVDASGRIFITGRKGSVINVAGRKVNPAEVENVLLGIPQVVQAEVVPSRDHYGEEAVKALIKASEACSSNEIIAYCRERLADYKVPRIIEIRLPELETQSS